jgi:hypothetical protein
MSNVVQFLENLARNPKPQSAEDLAIAIASTSLDPQVQQALIAGNACELSEALGGRARMICMIAPAENDEPQDDDRQNDEEESPDQETSSRAA